MNNQIKNIFRNLLPVTVWPWIILSGPIAGSRLVTSWHDYPAAILGYTETPLLSWFKNHVQPGETWLDIGAQYGYTAIALSRLVGKAGCVYAFEPMLRTAGHLSQTRQINQLSQLTIIPMALGKISDITMLDLPVTKGMVDSTITTRESTETIQVAGFDWLWPKINRDKPQVHGIKIDVQGMEIEVLAGMVDLLKEQHPRLVVEIHKGVDRAAFLEVIRQAGYHPKGIPIEPALGEIGPLYLDDKSYYFE